MLHAPQLVVFQGSPASLGRVAQQALLKSPHTHFLCLVEPGASSEPVRQVWELRIQPMSPLSHLFIMREPVAQQLESTIEFCVEYSKNRDADLDLLFLSEVSGFRESRRLARWLQTLQQRIELAIPKAVIRRI